MKVLMIMTEKLPVPPVRGGAIQTYAAAVAPRLARHCELTVLGVTDTALPDKEQVDGVTYARVAGSTLDTYRANIIKHLKQHTYDVIHIFNRPRLVLPVREAAPDARLFLSLHNDMFDLNKLESEEAPRVIAEVEGIATVSRYVGCRVTTLYPDAADKLHTIYSGVDPDRFVPIWSKEGQQIRRGLRQAHGLGNKKVVLFVGRLSPKKGADVLVRAMSLLAKSHPDAALVLVGSKWYSDERVSDYVAYIRSLAARSPLPVVSTGFVAADQVHKWFCAGDVFVCPSQWEEPLARVHYEAMAAGLPIVTTERGGNPEVITPDGNGLVVAKPDEPLAFAEAISHLLQSEDRRERMGRAGRKLVTERFTWDRVAEDIRSMWNK